MIEIILNKDSSLLQLPEKVYGTAKRIGMLNNEPILYGDINVIKPGSLYYIPGVKQIYRYIKPIFRKGAKSNTSIGGVQIGNPKPIPEPAPVEEYHFTTIEQTSTDSLMIPKEERGTIKNAGYLFNEIIYSGDPNLVDNGSLFYHDTLPYISIISNDDGVINLSTKQVNGEGEVINVVTEYRVSPDPGPDIDYKTIPLTFEILNEGEFYIKNGMINLNDTEWQEFINKSIEVQAGDIVRVKDADTSNRQLFEYTDCTFNVYGNIMSLLDGNNFQDMDELQNTFIMMFADLNVVSAENLVLPSTICSECYKQMFLDCKLLTKVPTLSAATLEQECYYGMFSGCVNLNNIKMLATDLTASDCLSGWVNGVAANGTFTKATGVEIPTGANGIPSGWTVVEVVPDEITI